jgi:BirA family biotin operon repressor/biotin-[acetyl-CoA-carboxylase] ligase
LSQRPPLVELDEVDSTNLHLKRLAAEGYPTGTIVTARRQTAGYGQRGRPWVSIADSGLYMSLLLPVPARPTQLPFVVGLGCLDGLKNWTPEVGLKWVNDLVARRRKLGGILVELGRQGAIAGMGVNVYTPDQVADAIGLEELCPKPPAFAALRDALLAGVLARHSAWQVGGFESIATAWSGASVTLGREIRMIGVEPEITGTAEALGPDGELLVRGADGNVQTVISGSVRTLDGHYC